MDYFLSFWRSCENCKRKMKGSRKKEDRISQLPDEILISIISSLTAKEAAATSLLSTRWRSLSPYVNCLSFPLFKPKLNNRKQIEKFRRIRFPAHIRFIDRVLDWHKGGRLKEFRVHTYDFNGANLGKWFEFALSKEVEIIDIRMECAYGPYGCNNEYYCLRQWANYNLVGEGQTLKCLKQLSLSRINVFGGEIQLLLSKFPLLESLSIYVFIVNDASIVGHSTSKLKHLHISSCRRTNGLKIEISNLVNLVSLGCHVESVITLNNVPNLIEFTMGHRCPAARTLSGMLSSIHHQLRTLKIFPSTMGEDYRSMLTKLTGLRNLELGCILVGGDVDVSSYDQKALDLCQACPSLEKLEIKFKCWELESHVKVKGDERLECKYGKKQLCPNLKKMKISGFIGSSQELRFVSSILTIVGALEELVVEACDENKKIRNLATKRAWRHFRSSEFRVLVV